MAADTLASAAGGQHACTPSAALAPPLWITERLGRRVGEPLPSRYTARAMGHEPRDRADLQEGGELNFRVHHPQVTLAEDAAFLREAMRRAGAY
jgi:hypothetical protein